MIILELSIAQSRHGFLWPLLVALGLISLIAYKNSTSARRNMAALPRAMYAHGEAGLPQNYGLWRGAASEYVRSPG